MSGTEHPTPRPAEEPVPGAPAGSTPNGAADATWHRVHPLTPFVRSWIIILALVWGVSSSLLDDVIAAVVKGDPVKWDVAGAVGVIGPLVLVLILGGVLALLVGLGLLSWWFTRYQVTAEHVRFRSGAVFRTQRQARLDRVQGIDIERKFVPRLLGLAALKFDVADGGSSALSLSYLSRDHARSLREQLLVAVRAAERHEHADRKAGVRPAPWEERVAAAGPGLSATHRATGPSGSRAGAEGPSDPSREVRAAERWGLLSEADDSRRVLTVSTARVLLSMLCSWPVLITALVVVGLVGALVLWPATLVVALPVAIPLVLGSFSALYSRLESSWGFTVSEVPQGVRCRYGLFSERSSTIPAGRVQALEVSRPLLWRGFGGHRVRVTTAGKSAVESAQALNSVVLPVGTRAQVEQLLSLVLPVPHPPTTLVDLGLDASGPGGGYDATTPRRARWLDPIVWRRTAVAAAPDVLALRRGRAGRHVSLIPRHKIQSVAWKQGPVERRLRLASLDVHTIAGPVATRVEHLVDRDVERIQVELTSPTPHESR